MGELEWVDKSEDTLADQHQLLTIRGENKNLVLQQDAGEKFESIVNTENVKEVKKWIVKNWQLIRFFG